MDEYIDIVGEDGEPSGERLLKSEVHKKGYRHKAARFSNEAVLL